MCPSNPHDPSSSPSPAHLLLITASLALLAATGCDAKVAATNPYDPATEPERQAPGSVAGTLVLREANAPRDALLDEIRLARVGLIGPDGEAVRAPDGSALHARLNLLETEENGEGVEGEAAAAFEFLALTPGTYRLRVEGIGSRYVPPGMPEVVLRPGERSFAGDLVFVSPHQDGPGTVRGTVKLEGSAGGPRLVELYRMTSEGSPASLNVPRPMLFTQVRTDESGIFTFDRLPVGTYAVNANLQSFTPDYRMDVAVGQGGDARLMHEFSGEDALTLFPVTAVLSPAVQQTEGTYYTNDDTVPLHVLAFGGVTAMRLATNPEFREANGEGDGGDDEIPFVQYSASAVVPLPDEEGRIELFAQFKSESPGGFSFVSPTFSTSVVRDVTPPRVLRALPLGASPNEDGGYFVAPGATLEIDAIDDQSAISGYAIVPADEAPDPDELGFEMHFNPGGLARITAPAPLPDADGSWPVLVFVRDRARNVSEGYEVLLQIDREAPELPLTIVNALDGRLRTRSALLEFDETGEDDLPVTMQVGPAPLRASVPVVAYEQALALEIPNQAHGALVAFEARLTDAAGNSALMRSESVVLHLTGSVEGVVELEGVPNLAEHHGGVAVELYEMGSSSGGSLVASTETSEDGVFAFEDVPEGGLYRLRMEAEGHAAAEQLVPFVAAGQQVGTLPVRMALARGELLGRFVRADEDEQAQSHGGILVLAGLRGPDRSALLTAVTLPGGEWSMDVPVSLDDEEWLVEATAQGYATAVAGTYTVEEGAVSVVEPDPEDQSSPRPVPLIPTAGDFSLCDPSAPIDPDCGHHECAHLEYASLDVLRVGLKNLTGVDEVRIATGEPFGAGDEHPPFESFSCQDDLLIHIGDMDDGRIEVFVQTKIGGESGPVFSRSFVRDTQAPSVASLSIEPGPGAILPGFTSATSISATIHADPENDGDGEVAPLAPARLLFAFGDEMHADPPPLGEDYLECRTGLPCSVELPLEGSEVLEGTHVLYAYLCDLAGNCSDEPASATVVHDRTQPSPLHGAAVSPAEDWVVEVPGKTYVRSPTYFVEIDLGEARGESDELLLGPDGQPLAAVAGYRLAVDDPLLTDQGVSVLQGDLQPHGSRLVQGPPLPPHDGEYRVYAQLIDAAGNATEIVPNTFYFDLTLDMTPPAVAFSLNQGDQVTNDPSVSLTIEPDPLDPAVSVELCRTGAFTCGATDLRDVPLADDSYELFEAGHPGADGLYTVHARFRDEAGNHSDRQASIRLDRTPPEKPTAHCGTCNFVNDTFHAGDPDLLLDVLAYDSGGPVAFIRYSVDGSAETVVPYGPPLALTLGGPGDYEVRLRAEDAAGNISPPRVYHFAVDTQAPTLQLSLAGGEQFTNSHDIRVDLQASADAAWMSVSADGPLGCDTASYEPFSPVKWLSLPPGEGPRTVSACVKDLAGNTVYREQGITVDTTPPQVTVTLDGGAPRTNSTTVEVSAVATEPVQFRYAVGTLDCSSITYSGTHDVSLPPSDVDLDTQDGIQRVFVCARDQAGNIGSSHASIILDTTGPGGVISLAGDPSHTNESTVEARVTGTHADVSHLFLEADLSPSFQCEAVDSNLFLPFSESRLVSLAPVNGTQTVWGCSRDDLGNLSVLDGVQIVFDDVPPSAPASLTAQVRSGYDHSGGVGSVIPDGGSTNDPLPRFSWAESTDVHGNPLVYSVELSSVSSFDSPELRASFQIETEYLPQFEIPEGTWHWRVVVMDQAGNRNYSGHSSFTADRTPPAPPVIEPLPARLKGSFQLHWQPGDGTSVVYYVHVNDPSGHTTLKEATTSTSILIPDSALIGPSHDDLYTVRVFALDEVQNMSDPGTEQFVFDDQPPCAGGASLSLDGGSPYTSTVAVTVGLGCQGEQPSMMEVNCDGSQFSAPYQPTFTCLLSGAQGSRQVTVTLFDEAGNERSPLTRSIIFDDQPPAPPALTPGNAINVNHSCAYIGVTDPATLESGASGFRRYEVREDAAAWMPASTNVLHGNTVIEFGLLQDRTSILEVRAVDWAGNVGQPSAALIAESSSQHIPTPLKLKHVCDGGRFAILKEDEPGLYPAAIGKALGWIDVRAWPEITLLDLETYTLRRFSGVDGLTGRHALHQDEGNRIHRVLDAACSPIDDRVLFAFLRPDEGSHKTFFGVWKDPIANPHALISHTDNVPDNHATDPGLGHGLAVNSIDLVEFTDADGHEGNFRAVVVDHDWRISTSQPRPEFENIRRVSRWGTWGQTLRVYGSIDEQNISGINTPKDKARFALGFHFGTVAYLAWSDDEEQWEVRRTTSAQSNTPTVGDPVPGLVFPTGGSAGFDREHSPWGTHARGSHFPHVSGSPSAVHRDFHVTIEGSGGSHVWAYDAWSLGSTLIGIGNTEGYAVERVEEGVSWLHPVLGDTFVRHSVLSTGLGDPSNYFQRFAPPVDDRRPIMATGNLGAGEPELLYHTRGTGFPQGIVIGLRDEDGCYVDPALLP